jgi:hypothetical protein
MKMIWDQLQMILVEYLTVRREMAIHKAI